MHVKCIVKLVIYPTISCSVPRCNFLGFNENEGSTAIDFMLPFLTEEIIEEYPYSSYVVSATYLGVTIRVSKFIESNKKVGGGVEVGGTHVLVLAGGEVEVTGPY